MRLIRITSEQIVFDSFEAVFHKSFGANQTLLSTMDGGRMKEQWSCASHMDVRSNNECAWQLRHLLDLNYTFPSAPFIFPNTSSTSDTYHVDCHEQCTIYDCGDALKYRILLTRVHLDSVCNLGFGAPLISSRRQSLKKSDRKRHALKAILKCLLRRIPLSSATPARVPFQSTSSLVSNCSRNATLLP